MNSNFHPNSQRSLSVNPWILVIAFLLPIGIGSTYFIQEHRYQTEKAEKGVLQAELSKLKEGLQNTQDQNSDQIKSAKQEVTSLKAQLKDQLDRDSTTIQDLNTKLTSTDTIAKNLRTELDTQKSAFKECMSDVGKIVDATEPLYERIQAGAGHLISLGTVIEGSTAGQKFSELHRAWKGEACQTSKKRISPPINE